MKFSKLHILKNIFVFSNVTCYSIVPSLSGLLQAPVTQWSFRTRSLT